MVFTERQTINSAVHPQRGGCCAPSERWLLTIYAVNQMQWDFSIVDTIGDQRFGPYSKVSLTQGLLVYFQ